MPDAKFLSGELSLWSAVMLGQGATESANLLDLAAAKLSSGETDLGIAASLRLFAATINQREQISFQQLLNKAADLLSSPSDKKTE